MCGLTGFISSSTSLHGKKYYHAHAEIAHRGPDDEGFFYLNSQNQYAFAKGEDTDKDILEHDDIREVGDIRFVMGHRRLSIIELSTQGHQPFQVENKVLCYNGEIYNYLELREELIAEGVEFQTHTDTEVFLAAYNTWKEKAFEKFNGMWAAAIYDLDTNELTLVRDRFGVKPLYYVENADGLYFSSEVRFFKPFGLLTEYDEHSIYQYIRYSETDFDESTFFKGVKQVEPGHYVKLTPSGVQISQYWGEDDLGGVNDPINNIESMLKAAIQLRLRSDVPVGSLLSGGIDSSLIVGMINSIKGLDNFEAYSAVFGDDRFSEEQYIRKNAEYLNFEPNYIYPKPNDLLQNIEELIHVQEMPFRSLSVLSQYLIYKDVAEQGKVKVLLNGQGADEIFTGYTEHYSFYFSTLLRQRKFMLLLSEFRAFMANKQMNLTRSLIWIAKTLLAEHMSKEDKYNFFNGSYVRKREKHSRKDFTPLKSRLYRNLSFSALREYLRYEDKNSMYFSLESRLPFLDYRLVKLAFSLPDEALIIKGDTKAQLRHLCKGKVAKEVYERKDKTGFVSPQESWQRNELKPEFDKVFDDIKSNGLFDFINASSIYDFYQSYVNKEHNDWALVWRLFCLYKWKEVWITPNK